jgi:hypothetical protein
VTRSCQFERADAARGFLSAFMLAIAVFMVAAESGRPAFAWQKPPRYYGMRADGSRVTGQKLTTLAADPRAPQPPDWQLDGQPLWDAPQAIRWLRDRATPLVESPPESFVEMATGDRLPGTVVGFDDGRSRPFDPLPPHLIVRPSTTFAPPLPVADPVARVATRYVRRVVWQRRPSESWQPGTVFFRDGRSLSFRAARWSQQGVQLLLADGPRAVVFSELAELHFPAADFWDLYWEEIAALCPSGDPRLWQFEAGDGLIATVSRQRTRLHHPSGAGEASRWIHGLQPVWSLDLMWLPHASVAAIRSFTTREAPLSRVAIAAERQQGWLTEEGSPLRVNRNVRRQPLMGGEGEFGWGFGVHATSRLEFELPTAARAFRSRVGLDTLSGRGGCIRAKVLIGAESNAAFDSGFLVGSEVTSDTGIVVLPVVAESGSNAPGAAVSSGAPSSSGSPNPSGASALGPRLTLEIDAAHDGRPMNADPFDIRDRAGWYDPMVELDPAMVDAEIAARVGRHVFAVAGWRREVAGAQLENAGAAGTSTTSAAPTVPNVRPQWSNQWDELAPSPGRFVVAESSSATTWRLTRELAVEPTDRWLVAAAHTLAAANPPPTLEIRIDGQPIASQALVARTAGLRDPAPVLVPLKAYAGRTVTMEARVGPAAPDGAAQPAPSPAPNAMTAGPWVVWRTLRASGQMPTLFEVLEDDADWAAAGKNPRPPAWDSTDKFSGERCVVIAAKGVEELVFPAHIAIRETPIWGEFRYARLAFKKQGKGVFSLEFLPIEPREKPLRLDGGVGPPAFGEAVRIYQAELPDQWVTVPIDLFATLGRFDARGLRLAATGDGPLRLDAIYLARTQADFELIPKK